MSVIINGLIQLSDRTPGVTTESQNAMFSYDAGDFVRVVSGLVFTGRIDGQTVQLGSVVTIDDVEFTLTGVFDFFAVGRTINMETGEQAPFQGQFLALRLEDPDGNPLNFIAPANSLLQGGAPGWNGDPFNSVTVFSAPTSEPAIFSYLNDEGEYENKLSGSEPEIPCFTAGTMIDTAAGPVAVEDLRPGDMVLTRDNGYLPVRWVGQRAFDASEVAASAALAPVCIAAGALGPGLPERATRVSPQHRMLVTGPRAELLFGEREVLVPAGSMVGLPGITRGSGDVTYVHIMFERHQIVRADGAWSESFQPADWAMDGLQPAQREELLLLFPQLASHEGRQEIASARMVLKPHEALALLHAA